MLIVIEGNIGAGKTDAIPKLAELLKMQHTTRYTKGDDSAYEKLLANGDFETVNTYIAQRLAQRNRDCVKRGGNWVVERSPSSSMVFGMAFDHSEETLNTIYKSVLEAPEPDVHVYIRTPAKVCSDRLRKRKDKPTFKSPYHNLKALRKLEKSYGEWASAGEETGKVLVIDYDEMTLEDLAKVIELYIETNRSVGAQFDKEEALKNA